MPHNQIKNIIKFTYNLDEGFLNPKTIQNGEEIILEKLSHCENFNYIELTSIFVEFTTHKHENQKFVCKILIKGTKGLVFDDKEHGSDFLETVRAASDKAITFLQKENNKRGEH